MPINKSQAKWVTKLGIKVKKMSLSVSYNQKVNNGIDTAALREVTQQIFQRANAKTSDLSNLDLTKFRRPDLGMDLYSGNVDSTTARQVAMTNSGLQVSLSQNALTSLNFLNAQASKVLFQGKEVKAVPAQEVADVPTETIKTADLGQDRRGSNPFYKGELLTLAGHKKEEKEEGLNIFA